jgi:hypothetical protein
MRRFRLRAAFACRLRLTATHQEYGDSAINSVTTAEPARHMRYGATMYGGLAVARATFHSTLTHEQQRGVKILGWVVVVVLGGLTITGIWQFFANEPDPAWFGHVVGSSARREASPSSGIGEAHGMFSTASGVIALLGGGWFAYKVIFDVPWIAVLAVGIVIFGSLTGSTMRFNAVKLEGQPYADAGPGYVQVYGTDIVHVVTDKWDLGPMAIRLLTMSHVLALPALLAIAWVSLPCVSESDR